MQPLAMERARKFNSIFDLNSVTNEGYPRDLTTLGVRFPSDPDCRDLPVRIDPAGGPSAPSSSGEYKQYV